MVIATIEELLLSTMSYHAILSSSFNSFAGTISAETGRLSPSRRNYQMIDVNF